MQFRGQIFGEAVDQGTNGHKLYVSKYNTSCENIGAELKPSRGRMGDNEVEDIRAVCVVF
jgi:hypothetical protein